VNSPYTSQPLDALMAAQTSVGLALGATIWAQRARPRVSTLLLLAAIVLAIMVPVEADFLRGIGIEVGPDSGKEVLKLAAALATAGVLVTRKRLPAIVAILGEACLWPITNYIQEGDWELAAAHLAFFGLLVGLDRSTPAGVEALQGEAETQPRALNEFWVDDAAAFVVGTVAASVVCWVVLHGRTNSGDEWADTFQAALFAKLHAYGAIPRCSEAFRSFMVFQYMGRSFAQYTPGWPYFMTPFVALRMPWLAGPASFGLMVAGVGRLGRRAAAGASPGAAPASHAYVRAGGRFAVIAAVLSSTLLINGGSRYPHVFVAAMFAWCIEALCVTTTERIPSREQRIWGAVLGASASWMLAARPADGAALGLGLLSYFVYAVARRHIGWQSVAAAAAVAAVIGGLSLLVLRLQMGRWFQTGYSLGEAIYPWNAVSWSLPKPNEYRTALPIGTGSYCWWPCSPAVGLAGVAALRSRARRLGFIFLFGVVPLFAFYWLFDIGRNYDFGYGPRYQLPAAVPMAVGTGVVLAGLWTRARTRSAGSALALGGPAAIAIAAVVLGVVRLAPLVYPTTYADVHEHNRLHDAIDAASLHDAVVFGGIGLNKTDPMDLTENLPLELYPNQDVLIAIDLGPEGIRCVKEKYRGRTFYRAIPGDPVRLVRY
jgi:hypothetical protein